MLKQRNLGVSKMARVTRKWNISLKVSSEEEEKIRIAAIKMGMGVGDYVKQAALAKFSLQQENNQGK